MAAELRIGQPTSAGIADAVLGGRDHFLTDQAVADEMIAVSPLVRDLARDCRAFLARAVTWAAEQGIRQYVNIGCGYGPATHEEAAAVRPDARTAYVDLDPVVVSHARALLAGPGVTAWQADMRDADGILARCEAEGFGPGEPSCLIFGAVLHYLPPAEGRAVTARYIPRLAPGSVMAVSLPAAADESLAERFARIYPAGTLHPYEHADAEALFGGMDLVRPGVTTARAWRAGWEQGGGTCGPLRVLAAAGIKPAVPRPR